MFPVKKIVFSPSPVKLMRKFAYSKLETRVPRIYVHRLVLRTYGITIDGMYACVISAMDADPRK